MLAIRITGNQLRAGRALADLSMEDLAARARLSRRTLSKWEGSSNAAPDAMVAHLGTHMLRPGNDPEVVARKLLREKHGRTSFYAAISYPH
jgi:AcrR family transcriptional regulator